MNAQEYSTVKNYIQEILQSKNVEDFLFDPLHKDHPKQEFPNLVYDIVGKIVNRFEFINWEDVEKKDHWIWSVVADELDKLILEEKDWHVDPLMGSPYE